MHGVEPLDPLTRAAEVIGERWSLLLVDALLTGPRRFGELQEAIPGIASNVLTDRLRRLERAGVLVGTAYSNRPPRLRYELTAHGAELAGVLRLLAQWGAGQPDTGEGLTHQACGTPVEARWWCPTCDRSVSDEEASELRFV
ncbi:MAG: winged helix-turn-helix transcriptional regulator [Acidimicrobiia bacterium]